MTRKITSVKLLKEQVTLKWETRVGDADVAHELKHGEAPAPELVNALADLRADAISILDFPKGYGDTFTLKGVSASYGDGEMTVTLTGTKKLKSGRTTTINTPSLPERTDHTQTGGGFLLNGTAERVRVLFAAAERYIDGERGQATIAGMEGTPATDPETEGDAEPEA